MTRTFRAMPSEPQEKLPESIRRARYFVFPPRVRTRCIRFAPIRVFAGWRPFSKALPMFQWLLTAKSWSRNTSSCGNVTSLHRLRSACVASHERYPCLRWFRDDCQLEEISFYDYCLCRVIVELEAGIPICLRFFSKEGVSKDIYVPRCVVALPAQMVFGTVLRWM